MSGQRAGRATRGALAVVCIFHVIWPAIAAAALFACDSERTAIIAGPPLTIEAPDAASSSAAVDAGPPVETSPITATFVDLTPKVMSVEVRSCETVVLAVTRGHGQTGAGIAVAGDYVIARGKGTLAVRGEGIALLAAIRDDACQAAGQGDAKPSLALVHGEAPELSWASGKMHAHLDLLEPLAGVAYVGRIDGTAAVPEHQHDGSWEVLAAIEGSGTLTIAGKATRVGPRTVVAIPKATKHSWAPDDGAHLVALQIYSPPGPEQRFKTLAAADDAGSDAASSDGGAKSDASKTREAKKRP